MKQHDRQTVRFHAIPHTHAVHVVWGDSVKNRFPRHTHSVLCMGIVDRGARVIIQRRSTTVVPEGHIFVLNPEESHACAPLHEEGHSYRIVCASTDFLQSVASQISCRKQGSPQFPRVLVSDPRLARLTNGFFTSLAEGTPLLEQQTALLALFSRLILSHAVDAPAMYRIDTHGAQIDRARAYIEEHFAANLTLEQLAHIACLSPFHFQRVFVNVVGVSPHEYLIQFRLRKARALLRDGLSIPHAALETGFADQSHFTRFFKRAMGITPRQYVRMGVRANPPTSCRSYRSCHVSPDFS
jgi:AraC-like DNA-binding protein